MASINIYVPDELGERVRNSGINVSAAARRGIEEALGIEGAGALRFPVVRASDHEVVLQRFDEHGDWIQDPVAPTPVVPVVAWDAAGKPVVAGPKALESAAEYASGNGFDDWFVRPAC